MSGFSVESHGFTKGSALIADVVTKMVNNGFAIKYLSSATNGDLTFNAATAGDTFRVTLEATGDVDPLNASNVAEKQPWRVCFDVQGADLVLAHVATPTQLSDDGLVAVVNKLTTYTVASGSGENQKTDTRKVMNPYDIVGTTGAVLTTGEIPNVDPAPQNANDGTQGKAVPARLSATGVWTPDSYLAATGRQADTPSDESVKDDVTKCLINRGRRVLTSGNGAPLSYRLAITPRGFWLGIWEDATTAEVATFFNWMLVQRPVDRNTGQVLTTGKAPVFCVNSIGNLIWQFTVREQDIYRPGKRRPADTDIEDSECIINTFNQVALSEDGKYIVTFPSRLNTSRYRYPHELDMIGITSADVVSQFTDVPLTVYGESSARTYKALHANSSSNTGMRILVLQQGGGIS